MTGEKLVIFDFLTRPAPELSAAERTEVKRVALSLLNQLKQLLGFNFNHPQSGSIFLTPPQESARRENMANKP